MSQSKVLLIHKPEEHIRHAKGPVHVSSYLPQLSVTLMVTSYTEVCFCFLYKREKIRGVGKKKLPEWLARGLPILTRASCATSSGSELRSNRDRSHRIQPVIKQD